MHEPDSTNLAESSTNRSPNNQELSPLRIKLNMAITTRRSSRLSSAGGASGSEYQASEKNDDDGMKVEEPEAKPPVEVVKSSRGRRLVKQNYLESSPEAEDDITSPTKSHQDAHAPLDDEDGEGEDDEEEMQPFRRPTRNVRKVHMDDDDDDDLGATRRLTRSRNSTKNLPDFIVDDEEDRRYNTRNRSKPNPRPSQPQQRTSGRSTRNSKRTAAKQTDQDNDFNPDNSDSNASLDAEGSLDDAPISSSEPEPDPEPEPEQEEETDGRPYSLRERRPVSYVIPPPLEELAKPPPRNTGSKGGRAGNKSKGRSLGWSASGAELGRWMGMPAEDSDSDAPTRTPRKPFGGIGPFGSGAVASGAGGMIGGDLAAGTPSNLGKIGDSALADADPLGVNQNVTFDEVGGLDDHIHALKEMTLLPLLYPEVFQRFNVTPPRGVLFHGPPGTGKTLLARALAASCRSGGRQISFFMRKGADCLSKWVGEAERQLRLLFEEARNSQPSIIFFDEIDGLAPVRSSKQDQIHASIVSTLLALMDGMDGRGQVVVIGATNRPDAVDPALRRPGRFDREFYFGLPGLEAREKILGIMTKKWEGWGAHEDDKGEEKQKEIKDRIAGLAKLTKGYGGADLRALCTEAALNAIQRRYPQVYKSTDRLLLKPETIGIGLRDFMISIKKLVPSSARSSSSAATPLPTQFAPLLSDSLEEVKEVIQRVLPVEKKLSALEEAEFEDDGGEEGALEREMLSQNMQKLRVYRPRVVIHGPAGMGQNYIGAAVLHHLEGYHVQSLEIGTLLSDSTRTVEAAIVQLFVEAKRNQPSVIYIPSLVGWCAAVSESSRSTVRAMLDTLQPTDPVLLLAVVDGRFAQLPKDVKAWFGGGKDNRVLLHSPAPTQRGEFFNGLIADIQRPPNNFADGMERRKRILEVLPIAPPLEPRKPTVAELALQAENDEKTITLLKYRLGPILTELKRKFKRFTKRATDEYNFDPHDYTGGGVETVTHTVIQVNESNGAAVPANEQATQPTENGQDVTMGGEVLEQQQVMQQLPPLYDMDLERMQIDLFKGRYLTPQDFLDDVGKIVHNASVRQHEDLERLAKAQMMFTATQVSIQEFDPAFKMECERMAVRERQRQDARRKEREKERERREKENPTEAPAGIRRSARHNGQEPEMAITDPVKLERKLKRQRGEDGSGHDSHGSEDGNRPDGGDKGRDAKRSRIITEKPDDDDPLDTLSGVHRNGYTPGSEVRHMMVRFQPTVEPMAPLISNPQPSNFQQIDSAPHYPNNIHSLYGQPYNYQQPPQQYPSNQPYSDTYNFSSIPQSYTENYHVDGMSIDAPAPASAIPSRLDDLLNPVLPATSPFHKSAYPIGPLNNGPTYRFDSPQLSTDPSDPFFPVPPSHGQPQQFHQRSHGAMPLRGILNNAKILTPPPSHLHVPASSNLSHPSIRKSHTPEIAGPSHHVSPAPEPEPVAMVVERTPTPPLPEFHVSADLVGELKQTLVRVTEGFNVEELEQLRATCLATVWRHRKEWDRDELVRTLLKDVKAFAADLKDEEEDDDDD